MENGLNIALVYMYVVFRLIFTQAVSELNAERQEISEAFKRVKKERDSTERELDTCREDKEKLEILYTEKIRESNELDAVSKIT